MLIIVSPLLTIPAWCALWGSVGQLRMRTIEQSTRLTLNPPVSSLCAVAAIAKHNTAALYFTAVRTFQTAWHFSSYFLTNIILFNGLTVNISLRICIFLFFLQNAWVHISGWVYRGDFGGLQLSHHLFLLHQNDKLPKFCQPYRGGMRLCLCVLPSFVIAYFVFDTCTAWWMKWMCSVLFNIRSRSQCDFFGGGFLCVCEGNMLFILFYSAVLRCRTA